MYPVASPQNTQTQNSELITTRISTQPHLQLIRIISGFTRFKNTVDPLLFSAFECTKFVLCYS